MTPGARSGPCPRRCSRAAAPAVTLAALLWALAAHGQGDDAQARRARADADACAQGSGVPALDIAACTRAIRAGGHPAPTIATLHNARGRANRVSGRLQAALADHDAAATASPWSADAFHGRAMVRLELEDRDGARSDLNRAVALNPHFADAWRDRGWLHFLSGDDAGARADLERAIDLDASDAAAHAYRGFVAFRQGRFDEADRDFRRGHERHLGYEYLPLWRYLSRVRAGRDGELVLRGALERLLAREWPRVLIEAVLGEGPEAAVAAELAAAPLPRRAARAAQAAFYLGQRELLAGRADAAAWHFDVVRARAPANSVERAMLPAAR